MTTMPRMLKTEIDTFWASIEINGPDECWPWIGSPKGIGRPRTQQGIHHKASVQGLVLGASRVAYFLATGIDPGNYWVLHTCDYPPCCNPVHLWLGTVADNARDAVAKGRWASKPPVMMGADNPATLLIKEMVMELRRRHSAGESYPRLAREFNKSISTIWAAVTYKTWKQVH